ncbi:MAG: peptide ABC transporter permease [bacterium]|nr:MAG: peptide ABC transporter permease [bacterium]
MLKFIANRTIQSLIVLVILSIIMFALIQLMPGDIKTQFRIEYGHLPKESELIKYKKKKGLDQPYPVQYLSLMSRFLTGDFGTSEQYQLKVTQILPQRILTTLKLSIPVFLLSLLIAIPIGIFAAVYQYTRFDYITNFIIFIGISIPTFWTGLMAIYIFSLKLQIFPASGIQTVGIDSFMDQAKHYILPILILSIHGIGSWVRYLRGGLLEILKLDYIRTARAKGLNEEKVILKHALKNAMIPLLTLVALSMPYLVSGALVTEQVFGIPGMGQLLFTSIKAQDRELALATFLFLAVLTLVFNLMADILYSTLDPRIKRD